MANAIIIVVLVLICVFAVRSYCRKLKQGCCGGGGDQVRKTGPEDRDLSHYPYTYQIGIDGMTCRNCEARMENALNRQDGVTEEGSEGVANGPDPGVPGDAPDGAGGGQ